MKEGSLVEDRHFIPAEKFYVMRYYSPKEIYEWCERNYPGNWEPIEEREEEPGTPFFEYRLAGVSVRGERPVIKNAIGEAGFQGSIFMAGNEQLRFDDVASAVLFAVIMEKELDIPFYLSYKRDCRCYGTHPDASQSDVARIKGFYDRYQRGEIDITAYGLVEPQICMEPKGPEIDALARRFSDLTKEMSERAEKEK